MELLFISGERYCSDLLTNQQDDKFNCIEVKKSKLIDTIHSYSNQLKSSYKAIVYELDEENQKNDHLLLTKFKQIINAPIILLFPQFQLFQNNYSQYLELSNVEDFLTAPFSPLELNQRIMKSLQKQVKTTFDFGRFQYNWDTETLINKESKEKVELLAKEKSMLSLFLKKEGQLISRQMILNQVWGDRYRGTERTVDNYILKLRSKTHKDHFVTVRQKGFIFKSHF